MDDEVDTDLSFIIILFEVNEEVEADISFFLLYYVLEVDEDLPVLNHCIVFFEMNKDILNLCLFEVDEDVLYHCIVYLRWIRRYLTIVLYI